MNAKKDKKPDRFLVSRKYTLANEFFFHKELEIAIVSIASKANTHNELPQIWT